SPLITEAVARVRLRMRQAAPYRWLLALAAAAMGWGAGGDLGLDVYRFAGAGAQVGAGHLALYSDDWMQAGPCEVLSTLPMQPLPVQHTEDFYLNPHGPSLDLAHAVGAAVLVLALMAAVRLLRRGLRLPQSPVQELAVGVIAVMCWLPSL